MHALVTGGGGFIGSHLVDRLLARGDEVTVFDTGLSRNLEGAKRHPAFRLVEGDVRRLDDVRRAFSGAPGTVFHLAAVVGVRNYIEDPLRTLDVNVIGTRNVLEAATGSGARVVLASTSEVFGKNPDVPWHEDADRVLGSTRVDRWSYATSKALAEHLTFAVHRQHDLPVTVVRFFNAYGPRQAPIFVISNNVRRVVNGEPPVVYDQGDQTRCFTYVEDAVEGALAAAESPAAVGEAFNIGSSTESTISEAVRTVLECAGLDREPEVVATADRYGPGYEDVPRRIPEVVKAREVLGWQATTSLRDGVARTLSWARENRWWLEGT